MRWAQGCLCETCTSEGNWRLLGPEIGNVPHCERVYLKVPFREKDEALALGAKWDPVARLWFTACWMDPASHAKWPV
eukprot:15443885-Alexandrium_andersonii.AAC.1